LPAVEAEVSRESLCVTEQRFLQREIPPGALARVASYSQVGSLALAPIGFALVGFAAAKVGVAAVLWFGAAWIIGSTAVVLTLSSIRGARVAFRSQIVRMQRVQVRT
jgi:hypothetical protein